MQFYCYECSLGKTYRLKLFHMTNNNLSCWLWMCVFAAVGNDSGSIYTEDICISNLKLLFCSLLHYTVLFCSVQFVFESYECSGLFKQYSYKWDDTQCSTEKCLSFFFSLTGLVYHPLIPLWQSQLKFSIQMNRTLCDEATYIRIKLWSEFKYRNYFNKNINDNI